ncbi:sensor histidine kinase [Rhizobium wenxiniae]|uniref:sensor histidine kinase n=1 Tax=Rhizobium wenxiniae TaxID=1737357 RepID=UPI003C151C1A
MTGTGKFFEKRSLIVRLQELVTRERSARFRWTLALSLFVVALVVRLLINEELPSGFPYLTFFPAVIIATLICGLWPGVVNAILSGLASWYFFIAPAYTFELTPGSVLALLFYAFIVSVDIFIIHTISVTSTSLRQQRHALAALAATKERENIQLLENDAYQKEMSLELAHRMKNQLALVQAIVAQTLRSTSDISAFSETLNGRIGVLAKAHDILIHGPSGHALVADIVKSTLALYDPDRLNVDGPAVEIAPRSALSLSLILHELGTNAAKYGALSPVAGTVDIGWTVSNATVPVFELVWQEVDGPKVTEPSRRGAGSRLIMAGLGAGSKVALHYDPAGLRCIVSVPFSELENQS